VSRPPRLRVVTLLDTLGMGGAERMAVAIACLLDPERFESLVCVSRHWHEAPLAADLSRAGIPVLELNRTRRAAIWDWKPLFRLLRDHPIDVLHAHKFGSNVWCATLGMLARVPVTVAHEHGSERDRLHYTVDRLLIGRAVDAVVAVSDAERRHMIEAEGIRPEKVHVIRNGIEPPQPVTADLRDEVGLAADVPVIGSVAMLRPEKALEVLVEATPLLLERFPTLHVLIAGSGGEEARLRSLVGELGLERSVHLLGLRADIANVLAALDVAVFTSDREAMPLATIEAMAAGKPVVATAVGGLPELIDDGMEGFLVPPRDPAALAAAVVPLLEDRELRERIGARGRERQRHELEIEATVSAVEQLYDDLWATRRRGRDRTPS
jgi:glycosyltransferase involved in cell wall biosynthesis